MAREAHTGVPHDPSPEAAEAEQGMINMVFRQTAISWSGAPKADIAITYLHGSVSL